MNDHSSASRFSVTLDFPVKKASVRVTSSWLDRFDTFTRFVFDMLAAGFTKTDIQLVTELQEHLIVEELNRLTGWGLTTQNDDCYQLTDLGSHYKRIMNLINYWNKLEISFYINNFNGMVMPHETLVSEQQSGRKMKSNVAFIQTQAANFNNAKELFIKEHLFSHSDSELLSIEEIDAIDIWLDIDKQTPPLYYTKIIDETDMQYIDPTPHKQHDIALQFNMVSVEVQVQHPLLEQHQTVIETLRKLHQYDGALLSEKAVSLVGLLESAEKIELADTYYFNPLNGELEESYNEPASFRNCYLINMNQELMPNISLIDEMLQLEDDFYVTCTNQSTKKYMGFVDSIKWLEEK